MRLRDVENLKTARVHHFHNLSHKFSCADLTRRQGKKLERDIESFIIESMLQAEWYLLFSSVFL